MSLRRPALLFGILTLLLSGCSKPVAVVSAPQPPSNIKIDLDFKGFLAQDLPEQDVYLEMVKGSKSVTRFDLKPTENLTNMSHIFEKQVYGSKSAQPHNYFTVGPAPFGPFEIGSRIGLALQQWSVGRGFGTYEVQSGTATVKATFHGLVRGGLYSLWCSKVSKDATIEWPCVQPGQPGNPLQADFHGRADLKTSFPALPDATTQTGAWLSLAYHSDHHKEAKLNDFGKDTHVQILMQLPTPAQAKPAW